MQKRIWLTMLFATLVIAGTANAQVTQIVLGNGLSNNGVTFTGTGSGATIAFVGTCGTSCITGYATFEPAVGSPTLGSFQMSITGGAPTLTGTVTGQSSYNVSMNSSTINFLFSMNQGTPSTTGTLSGTLSYVTIGNAQDLTPSFNGTFTTTSATGALASFWGAGTTTAAVFTLNTDSAGLVNSIVGQTGSSTTGAPYSGDVPAPAPPPVPEPATIAMLGSGLLALGGTLKRHLMK